MPGEHGEVQVLLSPEEYARIRDIAPERAEGWRLVPDERLELGECREVTARAAADIGCQQRLDSCMEALEQHIGVVEECAYAKASVWMVPCARWKVCSWRG